MSDVVVRDVRSLDEFRLCVELQEEVWGAGFSERAPVSLMKVSQRLGGVVAGAFAGGGELVGFVFGLTGWEEAEPVHWSDMLAVRPGHRGRGLGTRLKAYQRDRCLERGIERVYWTFDPLEAGNAHLNLGRLGAVAREYVPDMYGVSRSPLHEGIGTDRLVALWLIASPRVEGRMTRALAEAAEPGRAGAPDGAGREGTPAAGPGDDGEKDLDRRDRSLPAAFPVETHDDLVRPGRVRVRPEAGEGVRVPIPADIQDLKRRAPEVARAWRSAVRQALVHALDQGLEVRELIRGEDESPCYVLRPSEGTSGAARE